MGLAEYMIVSKPDGWTVLHDGTAQNDYDTKEAGVRGGRRRCVAGDPPGPRGPCQRPRSRGRQQDRAWREGFPKRAVITRAPRSTIEIIAATTGVNRGRTTRNSNERWRRNDRNTALNAAIRFSITCHKQDRDR